MNNQDQRPQLTDEPASARPNAPEPSASASTANPILPPSPRPPRNHRRKNLTIAVLAMLLLVAVCALAFLLMNKPAKAPSRAASTEKTQQEKEGNEEELKTTRFTSKLWPDLAFDVPAGWTATEPADYDPSSPEGAKLADGTITITDNDTTLKLFVTTVRLGGVEQATCYTKQELHKITDDIHRFAEDNKVIIESGFSSFSKVWEYLENENISFQPGNNFCQGISTFGTYSSRIKQSDGSKQWGFYGYPNNEYVMVWLRAEVTGDLTDSKVDAIDAIIMSLSDSAEIVPYN